MENAGRKKLVDFTVALAHIKQGRHVRRESWGNSEICLFRPPASPTDVEMHTGGDIFKKTDTGCHLWTPSQEELLATDWKVIPVG